MDGEPSADAKASSEQPSITIPRRATCVRSDGTRDTRPLEAWRGELAYVLLGDPGAGKTTSLRQEAIAAGVVCTTADVFQAGIFDVLPRETVFIDALDEARGASGPDALAAIAQQLRKIGRPQFRITCREADWRDEADRRLIAAAAPGGEVTTLHLEPLSREEVIQLLAGSGANRVSDPLQFVEEADRHGVTDLMTNPLLLELLVKAVGERGGRWPDSRAAVYESACRSLASEQSAVRLRVSPASPGQVDRILRDSARICATLILSASKAVALGHAVDLGDIELQALPGQLQFEDARGALASKVFTMEAGRAMPRHRTIAEYLGARAVAMRVRDGSTSLTRALIALRGLDSRPVESLRGIFAWLAVHLSGADRLTVLRADPLGFILNGDPAALQLDEARALLRALADEAQANPWFRGGQWNDDPFGALAHPRLVNDFEETLVSASRTDSHQAFMDCVLAAIEHARSPMVELVPALEQIVADPSFWPTVRMSALQAWRRHCRSDDQKPRVLDWLALVEQGAFGDPQDRLLGQLLRLAYPSMIQADVLRFLRPIGNRRVIAEFSEFWGYRFANLTPTDLLPVMADAWVNRFPDGIPDDWRYECQRAADELLVATLRHFGDAVPVSRLFAWLSIGTGEHGLSAGADDDSRKAVCAWLEAHPERMKDVYLFGCLAQTDTPRRYWYVDERLRGARRPRDWVRWLMVIAPTVTDQHLAKFLVIQVASTPWQDLQTFDVPSVEEIVAWVDHLTKTHPDARVWLQSVWYWSLDEWEWKREQKERQRAHQFQRAETLAARKAVIEPILSAPGHFSSNLLYDIAMAFGGHLLDVHGDTPEARILDLLQAPVTVLERVWSEIDALLDPARLPTVDKIFEVAARNRILHVGPPTLLAIARAIERDPKAWRQWQPDLLDKALAFSLTGFGEKTPLHQIVQAAEPTTVAKLLVKLHAESFTRREHQHLSGLESLGRTEESAALARMIALDLLKAFPERARPWAVHKLDQIILPALGRLPPSVAVSAMQARLQLPRLDRLQRISLLLALTAYEYGRLPELMDAVRNNKACIAHLGEALESQGLGRGGSALPAEVFAQITIKLGSITPNDEDWPGGTVTPLRSRHDQIGGIIQGLARNGTEESQRALERLAAAPELSSWRTRISYNMQTQRAVQREERFEALTVQEVADLLSGGAPANAGDLTAIIVEEVSQLAAHLRGDPSFQLRQYWPNAKPLDEELARDVFFRDMRNRLDRYRIDLQPESAAAARKTADMRATTYTLTGKRISVPMEAKKDSHRELWSAWRDQLQLMYSIDPSAKGSGIYLVLWYGVGTVRGPGGQTPTSAPEFKAELDSIVDDPRLQVCVVDLSWPAYAKHSV